MLLHDYEPYPMHKSGGTYMRTEPSMAKDHMAGFDIVSTAITTPVITVLKV